MIDDVRTMMWKEWREIVRGGTRGRLFPLIFLLIFGAYILPSALIGTGHDWSLALTFMIWLPFIFSANIIADSVAGERERHTLETLLASRLPDRAILFGKMFMTVLYAWGMALLGAALAIVVVNLDSTGGLVFYPIDILVGLIVLSLLAAMFISAMGVLISLKARTAREAQQIIGISSLIVPFGSLLVLPILPSDVQTYLSGGGIDAVMLVIGFTLFALGAVLTMIAVFQFKRTKLMTNA